MQFLHGWQHIPVTLRGCVATIGNFDGVHLGHQHLLSQTIAMATELKVPSVAVIFEPQPQEYFNPKQAPARLTRLREKVTALQRHTAIDYIVCLPFNRTLASLTPTEFIEKILLDKLNVKGLVLGADFKFGSQRQGDIALLTAVGKQQGFVVHQAETKELQGVRISSTQIRNFLAVGNLVAAQAMLGRTYSMMGQVIRGDQRGRQLGFPTANIHLKRKVSPLAGVYAVQVYGIASEPIYGVANVGTRPTVDGTRSLLEVYLLNFKQDIYGQHLEVEFIAKIRPEYKFPSLEALKQQIERDIEVAKHLFRSAIYTQGNHFG